MSRTISILLKSWIFVSTVISTKSDFVRHRDNVLNKGTWLKNEKENLNGKSGFGDLIFKPNSVNVEDFQDDFYGFKDNNVQDEPFMSSYIERAKRSPNSLEKGLRKSLSDCDEKDCYTKNSISNKPIIKSKISPKQNTASLVGMYPYDITILMNSVRNHNKVIEEPVSDAIDTNSINEVEPLDPTKTLNKQFEVVIGNEILVDDTLQNFNKNVTVPKRSMNKKYESELIKKIEIFEGLNSTKKDDRNIFDDITRSWHPMAKVPDTVNVYKVIPKHEEHAVSERGLVKLLSILTKTFKKIMSQHSEIKKMHTEMFAGKEDVDKSITLLISKFHDFESKYKDIKVTHQIIKELQKKMEAKEEYLKTKEAEMTHNLADFENQQKKFLTQQRQFYNIQKLMLAQNEKISNKQSLIAKTQSEISRRQNNFARILKKAKQIYIDKTQTNAKFELKANSRNETNNESITPAIPITTETVKIDLFSIPSLETRLLNQDKLILKEKNDHTVDELVYKYYFNNTFLDTLMKNYILSGALHGNKYMTRSAKTKRNEKDNTVISTILLPITNSTTDSNSNTTNNLVTGNRRAKRWIRHHHSKGKRRHHRFGNANYEMKDDKPSHPNLIANMIDKAENIVPTPTTLVNKAGPTNKIKPLDKEIPLKDSKDEVKLSGTVDTQSNPFKIMATNFCNQIGQNGNPLMLSWCVEKALRRLQNIETIPVVATLQQKVPVSTPNALGQDKFQPGQAQTTRGTSTTTPTVTTSAPNQPTVLFQTQAPTTADPKKAKVANMTSMLLSGFFPDNDELEANLKQYELKPDEEGNVYFEGSLHASEVLGHGDSDGFSDFMPGLDSNSRVEMDPVTFDIQAKRRADFRRMNEKMKTPKRMV